MATCRHENILEKHEKFHEKFFAREFLSCYSELLFFCILWEFLMTYVMTYDDYMWIDKENMTNNE
jgi:hypothetical protein